jgi:hypothetical protein
MPTTRDGEPQTSGETWCRELRLLEVSGSVVKAKMEWQNFECAVMFALGRSRISSIPPEGERWETPPQTRPQGMREVHHHILQLSFHNTARPPSAPSCGPQQSSAHPSLSPVAPRLPRPNRRPASSTQPTSTYVDGANRRTKSQYYSCPKSSTNLPPSSPQSPLSLPLGCGLSVCWPSRDNHGRSRREPDDVEVHPVSSPRIFTRGIGLHFSPILSTFALTECSCLAPILLGDRRGGEVVLTNSLDASVTKAMLKTLQKVKHPNTYHLTPYKFSMHPQNASYMAY